VRRPPPWVGRAQFVFSGRRRLCRRSVDFADAIKERGERLGVGDVDPLARRARVDDALAGPERLDDLGAE
jgi:hypothetical protein